MILLGAEIFVGLLLVAVAIEHFTDGLKSYTNEYHFRTVLWDKEQ